ncbi:hypothetical protein DFJ74DRAFT_489401 [Hyaloraphidium curvatum]|nr:hypothetical protein DFJ74DRAFT_489401 [Hyaloraphidium curvatum]
MAHSHCRNPVTPNHIHARTKARQRERERYATRRARGVPGAGKRARDGLRAGGRLLASGRAAAEWGRPRGQMPQCTTNAAARDALECSAVRGIGCPMGCTGRMFWNGVDTSRPPPCRTTRTRQQPVTATETPPQTFSSHEARNGPSSGLHPPLRPPGPRLPHGRTQRRRPRIGLPPFAHPAAAERLRHRRLPELWYEGRGVHAGELGSAGAGKVRMWVPAAVLINDDGRLIVRDGDRR